jgi:hypothetical protein
MNQNSTQVASKADFKIVYDGPALVSGAMDVRDLAPALLALSSLIDIINTRVNGSDKPVTMRFKSTSEGSLIAHLDLVTTWVQQAVALFTSTEGQNFKLIMDTLWGGGVFGGGAIAVKGIFQVVKFLKGGTAAKVEAGPTAGTINIYNISGDFITTNIATLELSQDPRVKSEAAKVVRPLEKDGVDSFAIRGERATDDSSIKKEDLVAFLPERADTAADENTSIIILQIVHPDLQDSNRWRFTDGNSPFTAVITDEVFMTRFRNKAFKVGHNDALKVVLVKRQSFTENHRLKTDYEVRRVVEYYDGGEPASGELFSGQLLIS